MNDFAWLPPLMNLSDHGGDVIFYLEATYARFRSDLVGNSSLELFGKPVIVSKELDYDGRHERFWHTITDPHNPTVSDIKFLRAERISWIRSIIENINSSKVLVYERKKKGDVRLHLLLPEKYYIVILTERKNAYYYTTAYHIDYTYKLNEYIREYKKYGPKTKTAP